MAMQDLPRPVSEDLLTEPGKAVHAKTMELPAQGAPHRFDIDAQAHGHAKLLVRHSLDGDFAFMFGADLDPHGRRLRLAQTCRYDRTPHRRAPPTCRLTGKPIRGSHLHFHAEFVEGNQEWEDCPPQKISENNIETATKQFLKVVSVNPPQRIEDPAASATRLEDFS